jgi:hypothetical protein
MMTSNKEILLAQPRGFCAGVDRAIEIVERALIQFGAPIYVRHEIVHNAYVVDVPRGQFLSRNWRMCRRGKPSCFLPMVYRRQ